MSHLPTLRALALAALGAFVAAACGSRPPDVSSFPLTACVLQGSAVADGCATDTRGDPVVVFGAVNFGSTVSKVVSLTSVAGAEVTEVKLGAGAPANVQLALFTLDAGREVPATLPFALAPRGSPPNDELRVRVTFVADPPGALSGVALEVTSRGKATSLPISAEALDETTGPFPLTPCVLQGSAVADGCVTDTEGNPAVLLGTVGFGRPASKVVSLTSAKDGVGAEVTGVSLSAGAPANVQIALFTLDGGSEVPATLPFALAPRGSPPNDELRVRVTFVADPAGALSGVALEVASGGQVRTLPISATGLDRVTVPFTGVECSGDPRCFIAEVDICAYLPDLRDDALHHDAFTVDYSNEGSC